MTLWQICRLTTITSTNIPENFLPREGCNIVHGVRWVNEQEVPLGLDEEEDWGMMWRGKAFCIWQGHYIAFVLNSRLYWTLCSGIMRKTDVMKDIKDKFVKENNGLKRYDVEDTSYELLFFVDNGLSDRMRSDHWKHAFNSLPYQFIFIELFALWNDPLCGVNHWCSWALVILDVCFRQQ